VKTVRSPKKRLLCELKKRVGHGGRTDAKREGGRGHHWRVVTSQPSSGSGHRDFWKWERLGKAGKMLVEGKRLVVHLEGLGEDFRCTGAMTGSSSEHATWGKETGVYKS